MMKGRNLSSKVCVFFNSKLYDIFDDTMGISL